MSSLLLELQGAGQADFTLRSLTWGAGISHVSGAAVTESSPQGMFALPVPSWAGWDIFHCHLNLFPLVPSEWLMKTLQKGSYSTFNCVCGAALNPRQFHPGCVLHEQDFSSWDEP